MDSSTCSIRSLQNTIITWYLLQWVLQTKIIIIIKTTTTKTPQTHLGHLVPIPAHCHLFAPLVSTMLLRIEVWSLLLKMAMVTTGVALRCLRSLSGLSVLACPRSCQQCLSLLLRGCVLTFEGWIGGSLLGSHKASVCFFKYPLCILPLLAVLLERSRSEQIVRTGKQTQIWKNGSITGRLKGQTYLEFQSLVWMVQKNLWSKLIWSRSLQLKVLTDSLACSLPLEMIHPQEAMLQQGWGATFCPCLVLGLLICMQSPGIANAQPLLFTFKKRNHIWLFSILLLHFYCCLQNSSEGQRKPFCLTSFIF